MCLNYCIFALSTSQANAYSRFWIKSLLSLQQFLFHILSFFTVYGSTCTADQDCQGKFPDANSVCVNGQCDCRSGSQLNHCSGTCETPGMLNQRQNTLIQFSSVVQQIGKRHCFNLVQESVIIVQKRGDQAIRSSFNSVFDILSFLAHFVDLFSLVMPLLKITPEFLTCVILPIAIFSILIDET